MVTKTEEEINEMRELIARGELPPDAIEKYYDAEARNVFGHDAKKVKGEYIEQGIGAAGNQSRNSIESYKKYHKDEPGYTETLARMEKELAESNKKRKRRVA
jgi:hypothetical protein